MYTEENQKDEINDYKNIVYFYNDFPKNIEKIESIKCYHCHKIYLRKDLDGLYLRKLLVKTQVRNSTIFNCIWYPLCSNCQINYENVIIIKL
jgi:hypothetical protein